MFIPRIPYSRSALILLLLSFCYIYFGCERKDTKTIIYTNLDSLEIFLQIDSIAYKNPGLALNLLETTFKNEENSNTIRSAYFLYYKGRITLLEKEGFSQTMNYLEKALIQAKRYDLLELQVKIYQEMSISLSKQRQLKKAMEILEKAFDLAERIDYKEISSLYIEAGWVLHDLDATNPKVKEYLFRAIEKHRNKKDTIFLAKVYHNLGTIHLEEGNLDSAMYYVKKALPIFEKLQYNNVLCNIYNTLGAIYEKRRDRTHALKYYKLSAIKGDLTDSETAFIYANIGRYYQFSIHDNTSALYYYLESLEKPGNPKIAYTVRKNIAGIYEQTGQIRLALENYKKSMELERSDLEQNYKESLKRLEVEFDVKRNKQKMKELDLDLKNQRMKSRQQRIFIVSLIAFILMGIALLLLFLRQKNMKQEFEKVLLEQQLLRSQMNPHFIFNAISVIQFLIKNNQNTQADKYLSKFSRLLRKSLESSTSQFTPVQDEVEMLEDYLSLQKLRFTDEFEYKIATYKGFENDLALIPPMIIQPFVENCIEHGIRNLGRKGEIVISLKTNKNTLICTIEDNGRGLNHNQNPIKSGKKSLSTKISKKRLDILKKKLKIESKIEIHDRSDFDHQQGTLVILTIPIVNSNPNV